MIDPHLDKGKANLRSLCCVTGHIVCYELLHGSVLHQEPLRGWVYIANCYRNVCASDEHGILFYDS
jgi:hypothetical protein